MSLQRTSAKPVSYKFNSSINATHANRHYAVGYADDVANGIDDHATVELLADGTEGYVVGELLNVDTESGECGVQRDGLMYLRTATVYDDGHNGLGVDGTGTAGVVDVDTADAGSGAPIIEGGGSVMVPNAQRTAEVAVNVLKCRR